MSVAALTDPDFAILKVKVRRDLAEEIKESLIEYFEDFFPTDEIEILREE